MTGKLRVYDTPSNLFSPRRIASTAEIDSRFWRDGRLFLLTADPSIFPRLLAAGAAHGPKHAFIRQEAKIDFAALDNYLPFVARQTIVPILGDLIPSTSWGSSLANLLTKTCWDQLRQRTFALTGFRCEICGSNHQLECHELWEYHEPLPTAEDPCGVQRLLRLMGLCRLCHETHHLGLAQVRGRFEFVSGRIAAYNRWSDEEFKRYFDFLAVRYERRSNCSWVLDVSGVADTLLVVQGRWQLEDDGFLCCDTHTGTSETMLLGARWRHAGVTYEAISPDLSEIPPPQAPEIAVEQGRGVSAPILAPKAGKPAVRPRRAWGGKYDELGGTENQ